MNKTLLLTAIFALAAVSAEAKSLVSYDTGEYTINKVRTAQDGKKQIIVGASYDGEVVAMDYSGKMLWEQKAGDGTINHDVWCADITGDDRDEILAASGDGYLYCFDIDGKPMWRYTPVEGVHRTPMYAVTVVRDEAKTPYVVCGNFDTSIYYLDAKGKLVKELDSRGYSQSKTWGPAETTPPPGVSYANFLRAIPQADGSDLLLVHGANNHMQGTGIFYIFKPLADKPQYINTKPGTKAEIGDLRVIDPDGDGKYDLMYSNSELQGASMGVLSFTDTSYTKSNPVVAGTFNAKITGTSYKVNQTLPIYDGKGGYYYITLSSQRLFTYDMNKSPIFEKDKYLKCYMGNYAFFDAQSDKSGKLILASSIDGGSCIHIFDTTNSSWMKEFAAMRPIGKIATLEANHAEVRNLLTKFKKPAWQRDPIQVVGLEGANMDVVPSLTNKASIEVYDLKNSPHKQKRDWIKKEYAGTVYENSRGDRRMKYDWTQQQLVDNAASTYKDLPGISMWGGHGNDPLFYQVETLTKMADVGAKMGKKTIYIYPEMNSHNDDFTQVLEKQIYPLAEHIAKIGGHICLRNKNIYFQGPIYLEPFAPIISGKYADVFIPAMEESTDKTQDLSIVGRMGLWMAGSVNGWAVRTTRDESSFDRSRQFSSQTVANHFYRQTILSLACGAKYIHNAYMNNEHMSLYLELLDKEALFVPERDEIVSFSPVHISMTSPPSKRYLGSTSDKWNIKFDREYENNNPAVFSHLDGSWLGGALTPWDFSTYASGVKDRRQNFIPSWPYGTVLITPVQNGALADNDAPRGKMVDKMHPLYRDIIKEYITDGEDYISSDGKQHYKANEFYTQVANDIKEGAKRLPVNVTAIDGYRAGWVVAQMDERHLRLTIVDGGFLNPKDGKVTVSFNGIEPTEVVDILDGTSYKTTKGKSVEVDVPCGSFRFINITLAEPFLK